MTEPDQTPTDQPPQRHSAPNVNAPQEPAYGPRPPSEEVARELHVNGVLIKCPADCLAPLGRRRQQRRRPLQRGRLRGARLADGPAAQSVSPPMTIQFSLFDATGDAGNCSNGGSGGYSDIGPGTPVTVTDETGKIIGALCRVTPASPCPRPAPLLAALTPAATLTEPDGRCRQGPGDGSALLACDHYHRGGRR